MLPCVEVNNMMNGGHAHAISLAQARDSHALPVECAHFDDLRFREPCIGLRFSARLATLANHIGAIVGGCSQEQMGGVHAARIVFSVWAVMADIHAVWDRAKVKFVAEAMRLVGLLLEGCHAVSVSIERPLPYPALGNVASLDLCPERFFAGAETHGVPVMAVDEPDGFALDLAASNSVSFGEWGKLPTTAVAITVGNFVRGMISHSEFSFQNLLTPPNDSTRCGGNFIGRYSFIIPQEIH